MERVIPAFASTASGSALNQLGVSLRASGNAVAASAVYRRALERDHANPGLLSNLGNALKDLQRFNEAIEMHRQALKLSPKSSQFTTNLGVALREAGFLDEALVAFERALFLDPTNVGARFDRAQVLLMNGDYRRGLQEFEWRWRLPFVKPRKFRQPLWDGKELRNGAVLFWPEQGFGDTILCARFLPLIKKRVGKVILGCQPELARLFSTLDGVDEIVPYNTPLPAFDAHCPLMSVARFFVNDLKTVPLPARIDIPKIGYHELEQAIATAGQRFKIGIVWSGSTTFKSNHLRSTTLERFLELTAVPGIQLFSLQKGPRAIDLERTGGDRIVIDLAPLLTDFAETAAAIRDLDLVVMADSSVAHLSGSLGVPVWNLLHHVPYWLYLRNRDDSPWYPSMRLFRQKRPGDWDEVFSRVQAALRIRVKEHGAGRSFKI